MQKFKFEIKRANLGKHRARSPIYKRVRHSNNISVIEKNTTAQDVRRCQDPRKESRQG